MLTIPEKAIEQVILVDEEDRFLGIAEKIEAHAQKMLHRAFSVLIFDSKGNMLLQKRYKGKYHSGGLWTNACCGHPRPHETVAEAAHRRLKEEMGLSCALNKAFSFIYQADLDQNMSEFEYDHVFVGQTDTKPVLNPIEAEDFRYISMPELLNEVQTSPENFTVWFKILLPKIIQYQHDA